MEDERTGNLSKFLASQHACVGKTNFYCSKGNRSKLQFALIQFLIDAARVYRVLLLLAYQQVHANVSIKAIHDVVFRKQAALVTILCGSGWSIWLFSTAFPQFNSYIRQVGRIPIVQCSVRWQQSCFCVAVEDLNSLKEWMCARDVAEYLLLPPLSDWKRI